MQPPVSIACTVKLPGAVTRIVNVVSPVLHTNWLVTFPEGEAIRVAESPGHIATGPAGEMAGVGVIGIFTTEIELETLLQPSVLVRVRK
jgi:hypothetical protein